MCIHIIEGCLTVVSKRQFTFYSFNYLSTTCVILHYYFEQWHKLKIYVVIIIMNTDYFQLIKTIWFLQRDYIIFICIAKMYSTEA